MPTIIDVAKKAGVSVATVSRIINQTTFVSESKVEKVQQAIKALNFTPNYHAQNLTNNPKIGPAMIVQSIQDPLTATLLKELSAHASANSMPLHLVSGAHSEQQEIEMLENYLSLGVQSLYFESVYMKEERLAEFVRLHPGLLVAKRYLPAYPKQCLHLDLVASLWLAVKLLVERGHKQLSVMCEAQQFHAIEQSLSHIDSPFKQANISLSRLSHDPNDCLNRDIVCSKASAFVCLSARLSWPVWQQLKDQLGASKPFEFIGASNNAADSKASYSTLYYPVQAMAQQALGFLSASQQDVSKVFIAQLQERYSEQELCYLQDLGAAG
ncbi:LacI family DNA-binding transcriptional regulator [Agarivorans aestuarii]|uniref:LacI family DNA-binding transcriptional regulator n=1 Tax=Agarivorans aestuarii TaxID=1563703 RepID=A0ABU7G2Y9_9ALTE|nr:LacI family DNA-binding transcriptional regulator [Agarivorans aestuarii]MEE1673655.1 LacI family DNA-binding transcriptional regulator [Agarivorans aestuarii]